MKKPLPIGTDDFKKIREGGMYYIDKTLLIRDVIQNTNEVSLITRPRRFGKTLNMTMLREFFDISTDSRDIFNGLSIMDTEYGGLINTRPTVFLSFKDCKERTKNNLRDSINNILFMEYDKYFQILKGNVNESESYYYRFFALYEKLRNNKASFNEIKRSLHLLERVLYDYYKIKPIVLIDEYDQPIISSFEYGYFGQLKEFFSGFYGMALKGHECLDQAVLTGIQRIVKESIFSQLNNVSVFTVANERYSKYFGFDSDEAEKLLSHYGRSLDETVKNKYNGYLFGQTEIYNPWSLLNYADSGQLENYWINTSTNYLVRKSVCEAGEYFKKSFDRLIANGIAKVSVDLECSFIEIRHNDTLWGLLINSGYVTVVERISNVFMNVRIPNGEVRDEFIKIVADRTNVQSQDLQLMFQCLFYKDMDGFMDVYRELVVSCTSYFDAKENAYHMLFLGMCISLNNLYKVTSNIESGYGRSDIRLESFSNDRPHIVIEFKQGEDLEALKDEALRQICENEYYAGLDGEVLCIGISHDKKRCALAHEIVTI